MSGDEAGKEVWPMHKGVIRRSIQGSCYRITGEN